MVQIHPPQPIFPTVYFQFPPIANIGLSDSVGIKPTVHLKNALIALLIGGALTGIPYLPQLTSMPDPFGDRFVTATTPLIVPGFLVAFVGGRPPHDLSTIFHRSTGPSPGYGPDVGLFGDEGRETQPLTRGRSLTRSLHAQIGGSQALTDTVSP